MREEIVEVLTTVPLGEELLLKRHAAAPRIYQLRRVDYGISAIAGVWRARLRSVGGFVDEGYCRAVWFRLGNLLLRLFHFASACVFVSHATLDATKFCDFATRGALANSAATAPGLVLLPLAASGSAERL